MMKFQMIEKCTLIAGIIGICTLSLSASAEMKVQNSQYEASKSAIYLKGKTSADTNTVYVLNAGSMALIGTADVVKKQFRTNLSVTSGQVPCMIQIQSNPPGRGNPRDRRGRTASDPGEFTVVQVRHAGDQCS